MLTKDIEKDLQHYIDEHIKMQFFCYNLSSAADKLGFPGFSHYFQVQAQDEVLHQRRIMNFVLDRDGHYQIKNIAEEYKDIKNIIELMETYQTKRAYFAELTNKLAQHANTVGDLVTYKFYD